MPFLIYFSSLRILTFNQKYYQYSFEKNDVYSVLPNAEELNREVILFLSNKQETLPDVFNEREKSHLEDVKGLFNLIFWIGYILFVFTYLIYVTYLLL